MKTQHTLRPRRHAGKQRVAPARRGPTQCAELEIKMAVPAGAWPQLEAFMSGPDAHAVPLHAIYFDTADRDLGNARMAVRLRRDATSWTQTLKAPGAQAIERLEDEVTVGSALREGPAPGVDLRRHRSAAAKVALQAALGLKPGDTHPALEPVFEVKVQRRVRRIAHGDAVIEVALDDGQILAQGRSLPVRELELELIEGAPHELLAAAGRWRQRWGLWLSTASKASRGQRLAVGELYGPPVAAPALRLPHKPKQGGFGAAVLDACMTHILGNASEVAAGSQSDEHIHQLRVGIRRLRTALREVPVLAEQAHRFESPLVTVFRGLGERRDRTHVLRAIQPLVEAAGGAPLRVPPDFHDGADPGELVRSDSFQAALAGLLMLAEQLRSGGGKGVRHVVSKHLDRLQAQVTREAQRFNRLSEDRQHRVRKRLKRLRYLSEFAAPLYRSGEVEDYLQHLKPVQDALGRYNDEIMAAGLYEELVGRDPGAQFGVDWLQQRRAGQAKACRKELRKMECAQTFW